MMLSSFFNLSFLIYCRIYLTKVSKTNRVLVSFFVSLFCLASEAGEREKDLDVTKLGSDRFGDLILFLSPSLLSFCRLVWVCLWVAKGTYPTFCNKGNFSREIGLWMLFIFELSISLNNPPLISIKCWKIAKPLLSRKKNLFYTKNIKGQLLFILPKAAYFFDKKGFATLFSGCHHGSHGLQRKKYNTVKVLYDTHAKSSFFLDHGSWHLD